MALGKINPHIIATICRSTEIPVPRNNFLLLVITRNEFFLPILSNLNLLILQDLTIFIYLKTKAESDGYRSIMYRIADNWIHLFIKAIFPLSTYDDEPSVSK